MGLVYVGGSVFVDDEKVDVKKAAPRDWSPATAQLSVYPYVRFPSMERSEFGLALTKGAPTDPWIDWEKVGDNRYMEPIAPLADVRDAQKTMERYRGMLDEAPYAELDDENVYLELLATHLKEGISEIGSWTPEKLARVREESHWDGSGVYDLRDMLKAHATVEDYERESAQYWADQDLEGMFQGDEWKKALPKLLIRNA